METAPDGKVVELVLDNATQAEFDQQTLLL